GAGLLFQQYRNGIKGPFSPWFAGTLLKNQLIFRTLNQRVPGSSPGAPTIQVKQATSNTPWFDHAAEPAFYRRVCNSVPASGVITSASALWQQR
ncbi:hypothetical protein ACP3WE_24015, partial [Salmonella enterica]|uniref:hypothetical protein n=1 Tax=Salmonella enterica TaxID=28901 RepID=UPI003CF66154